MSVLTQLMAFPSITPSAFRFVLISAIYRCNKRDCRTCKTTQKIEKRIKNATTGFSMHHLSLAFLSVVEE
jgi:hypothetical protein